MQAAAASASAALLPSNTTLTPSVAPSRRIGRPPKNKALVPQAPAIASLLAQAASSASLSLSSTPSITFYEDDDFFCVRIPRVLLPENHPQRTKASASLIGTDPDQVDENTMKNEDETDQPKKRGKKRKEPDSPIKTEEEQDDGEPKKKKRKMNDANLELVQEPESETKTFDQEEQDSTEIEDSEDKKLKKKGKKGRPEEPLFDFGQVVWVTPADPLNPVWYSATILDRMVLDEKGDPSYLPSDEGRRKAKAPLPPSITTRPKQCTRMGLQGFIYNLHYPGFNKRFDEWINESWLFREPPRSVIIGKQP
jgi:hypothetical protein